MAGALDELGRGFITTIDLAKAKEFKPNIKLLLEDLALSNRVDVYHEPTSYIWRLMKMIDEDTLEVKGCVLFLCKEQIWGRVK